MPWQQHTEVGKSFLAKVSLSPRGQISLSDGAVKKFGLIQYRYVSLWFNDDTDEVGIQLLGEKGQASVKIVHRTTGAYIAAASFMGKFGIKLAATTIYDLEQDAENGMLVFDLNKGKARGPGRKQADGSRNGSRLHNNR